MGKMLTPSNLKFAKLEVYGLDEYVDRIKKAGNDIDDVIAEAIEESAKPIVQDIEAWAEKHKLTGATFKGVTMTPVQKEGNEIYVFVGIDTNISKNAWHAVFVEYGSPTQPADPGIRLAFSQNKSKVKKIQKSVFERRGLPNE